MVLSFSEDPLQEPWNRAFQGTMDSSFKDRKETPICSTFGTIEPCRSRNEDSFGPWAGHWALWGMKTAGDP